jgi:hypothetical protein
MTVVISLSHQAHSCYQVSIPAERSCQDLLRSRRRARSRTGQQTDSVRCQRRASQALRACLHHSRLFPALDVIAISSPAPLSDTCSRCEPAGRVHLEANCTTSASRQISGSRRRQSAGSYPLRGCLLTLTYSSGASSWRMLHSGRLSLCAPNGGRQAPAIFHTGSMQLRSGTLICSAGSVLVSQGGHSSVASRCPCWP